MTQLESFLIGFVIGQLVFTAIRWILVDRKRSGISVKALAAQLRDHSSRIYTIEAEVGIEHPIGEQDLVRRAFLAGQSTGTLQPLVWIFSAIDRIIRRRP